MNRYIFITTTWNSIYITHTTNPDFVSIGYKESKQLTRSIRLVTFDCLVTKCDFDLRGS